VFENENPSICRIPLVRSLGVGLLGWLLPATVVLASAVAARSATTHATAKPTLVVDNSFTIRTSDPQRAFDPTASIVDRALYDTLFTYKRDDLAHPVPLLVRSWTESKDARRFAFQLKPNVHFADGTHLTSADVVWSLDRLINLKGSPAFLLAGVKISAEGEYGVAMSSETPDSQLLSILADPSTGILNSKLVREHGGTDLVSAPTADTAEAWLDSSASTGAGSGPYTIGSYSTTSQIVLVRNADYWGAKRSAFSSVVIRNMISTTQLLNIQRGSHEIAIDLSADQAQTLKSARNVNVSLRPSTWTFYAVANDNPQISSITPNRQFQQAVRYALDYKGLLSIAGPGAVQAPGIIPSMIPGALPQKDAIKQDLPKAKAALAASGVGTQQVTLEYPSDLSINGVMFASLAQKVQANLQAAGFNVALSGSPTATWLTKWRAGKIAFGLSLWTPDYPDPADYLVFTPGKLVGLHAGWSAGSDPAIEKLAEKAVVTTAPAARTLLYRRIQLALNEQGPFFPLMQPTQVFAATSDLEHAVFNGVYDVDVTTVTPR
jgi:peptide/nickel transport system substrate-binding protein